MADVEPGRRHLQLQRAFSKALDASIAGVGQDVLQYFPKDMSAEDKETIGAYWKNMTQNVLQNIQSEFNVICGERELASKLNELDLLIAEQPYLADGLRITPEYFKSAVSDVVRARLLARKQLEKQKLLEALAKVEADTQEVQARLGPQCEQARVVTERLQQRVQATDQALKSLAP